MACKGLLGPLMKSTTRSTHSASQGSEEEDFIFSHLPQIVPERPLVASFVSSCCFFIHNLGLTLSISSAGLIGSNELSDAPGGRYPNLSPTFVAALLRKLNMRFIPDGKGDLQETFGPEDVFNYMYAVFHAPYLSQPVCRLLKSRLSTLAPGQPA